MTAEAVEQVVEAVQAGAVEPEVLPAQIPHGAEFGDPALQQHVKRIHDHQEKIQEFLQGFAQRVVLCGFDLLALKKSIKHGQWQNVYEQHLAGPNFTLRHAQRYMKVAKVVRKKLKNDTMSFLDGSRPLPANAGEDTAEQLATVKDAIADLTDATTWTDLLIDLGLMREPKPATGGARKYEAWLKKNHPDLAEQGVRSKDLPEDVRRQWLIYCGETKPTAEERIRMERDAATTEWLERRVHLEEFGLRQASWGKLLDGDLRDLESTLGDLLKMIRNALRERGVR